MLDPLLLDIPLEISTSRITLRAYKASDAAAIHEAIVESAEELSKFFAWAKNPPSIEQRMINLTRASAYRILRTELGYGIWSKDSEQLLGDIGLYNLDWNTRRFEIGYWLRTSAVGHGFVTESARLLCDLAFTTMHANRVCIQCDADNLKSAGIPHRLGFEFEGTLKNNNRRPDGTLADTLVFGMTPLRWQALQNN